MLSNDPVDLGPFPARCRYRFWLMPMRAYVGGKPKRRPRATFPSIGTIDRRIRLPAARTRPAFRGHGPRKPARRPRCGSPYGTSKRHRRADPDRFGCLHRRVDHRDSPRCALANHREGLSRSQTLSPRRLGYSVHIGAKCHGRG